MMNMGKLAGVGALCLSLGLAACESAGTKETIGTIGGAAAGGLVGSQIGGGSGQLAATAIGVLLGAFIGNEVGKSLDKADQAYATNTAGNALESNTSGQTSTWSNPDSGNSGTITPTQTSYSESGEPCREYQQTVVIGGEMQEAYGTACRNPDGTWRIEK